MQGGCSTWRLVATGMIAVSLIPCIYLLIKNIQGLEFAQMVTSLHDWAGGLLDEALSEGVDEIAILYIFRVLEYCMIAGIALSCLAILVCVVSLLLVQFPSTRNGMYLFLIYMPLYMLAMLIMLIVNSVHFKDVNIEYAVVLSVTILLSIASEFLVYKRFAEMGAPLEEDGVMDRGRVYPHHFHQAPEGYSQPVPTVDGRMYPSQPQPALAGYSQVMPAGE